MPVGAETEIARNQVAVDLDGVEDDALSLPQHAKRRSLERSGAKCHFAAIAVTANDTDAGNGIVDLDDTLHG